MLLGSFAVEETGICSDCWVVMAYLGSVYLVLSRISL